MILTSSKSTLRKKDNEATKGKTLYKGNVPFKPKVFYNKLLLENKLLFTVDLIKEKLANANQITVKDKMANKNIDIMDIFKNHCLRNIPDICR